MVREAGRIETPDLEAGLRAGEEAVRHAAAAISSLRGRLSDLPRALGLMLDVEGRVVVTGVGKSGLVGAKLAATLSSTGTSAYFIHAADALHGDAGSVDGRDVVLAISNSGETPEVCLFAELVKDRGTAVVAMTGCGGGSRLCRLADATLDVRVEREADPYDLVPSSSTAAAAVLGDALAIALMVARGFGPYDFHRHHPAGSLGQRLAGEG
jgi:arabinose-5-phosphate isomerase